MTILGFVLAKMKKADINFSFDKYMMRCRDLFWGKTNMLETAVLKIPSFTEVVLNSILSSLCFFVLTQKRTKKNQGCFHFLTLKLF